MIGKIYIKSNNQYDDVDVYNIKTILEDNQLLVYNSYGAYFLKPLKHPDIILVEFTK